ncbi:MAG: hypothetical protein ACE5HG_00630 [Candidatus Bathyarchaeia archaeon]
MCRHTERFRRQEKLGHLVPLREEGKSPNQIQGLRTRGNITTVSSYKGELVNLIQADVGIRVDTEDDSSSVGVLNAGAHYFLIPASGLHEIKLL